jgi:hypothetical protein
MQVDAWHRQWARHEQEMVDNATALLKRIECDRETAMAGIAGREAHCAYSLAVASLQSVPPTEEIFRCYLNAPSGTARMTLEGVVAPVWGVHGKGGSGSATSSLAHGATALMSLHQSGFARSWVGYPMTCAVTRLKPITETALGKTCIYTARIM